MPFYYPVFLNLQDRPCVVVGGGPVAEGKLPNLLEAGARVTVIAPEAEPGIARLAEEGRVTWIRREYQPGDLKGCFLAIAATDDPRVNRQIYEEAEYERVLLNVVDQTHLCMFTAPSVVRRGEVTVAISTGGASPALARRLREMMQNCCALEYADLAGVLNRTRQELKRRGVSVHPDRWQELMDFSLLCLVRQGREEEAYQRLIAGLLEGTAPPEENR